MPSQGEMDVETIVPACEEQGKLGTPYLCRVLSTKRVRYQFCLVLHSLPVTCAAIEG